MEIRMEKVKAEEKEILHRLLQYSLYEESGTDQNEMGDDGLFEYQWFDCYFEQQDKMQRDAYFIREQETGKLLGFVMVNEYLQKFSEGHSIAEFMVLPKYRRCGIGKKAAVWCFEAYRGNWEVQPSYGSEKAYQFWMSVIEEYTDGECRFEDGIFLFQTNFFVRR